MGNQSNTVSISNPVPFKKRKNEALKKKKIWKITASTLVLCALPPPPSHTENALEQLILLSPLPKCRDCRHMSPPMAWISCFKKLF